MDISNNVWLQPYFLKETILAMVAYYCVIFKIFIDSGVLQKDVYEIGGNIQRGY